MARRTKFKLGRFFKGNSDNNGSHTRRRHHHHSSNCPKRRKQKCKYQTRIDDQNKLSRRRNGLFIFAVHVRPP